MSIQQTIFASSEVLAQRLGLRRSGKRYVGACSACGYSNAFTVKVRDVTVLADGDDAGERRVRITHSPQGLEFNDLIMDCSFRFARHLS
jgi:hypothetical protein